MTTLLSPLPAEMPRIYEPERFRDVYSRVIVGQRIPRPPVLVPRNPERRRRARLDPEFFIETYLAHAYKDPCEYHHDNIAELTAMILTQARVLFQKAEAGPRGVGKSTIKRHLVLWGSLNRHFEMPLFIGNKAAKAEEHVLTIKAEIKDNELLNEDYPEICRIVRERGGDPKRMPPDLPWRDDCAKLANGVYLLARGIDSALEGTNIENKRPDIIVADDLESAESVASVAETEKIRRNFEASKGMFQPNRRSIYIFVGNVRSDDCLTAEYTDPERQPEWRGKRYKALKKPPEREDLWETFCNYIRPENLRSALLEKLPDDVTPEASAAAAGLSLEDFAKLTPGHQAAYRFYAGHKAEMDAGAELLDPVRLPLHRCYYIIATHGLNFFLTEYQGEPPERKDRRSEQFEIAYLLQRRVGPPQKVVPAWADRLTGTIDIGSHACHWQIDALSPDGFTTALIDEGIEQTELNKGGIYRLTDDVNARQVMVKTAVQGALERLRERFAQPYAREVIQAGTDLEPRTGLTPFAVGVDCGGVADGFAWYEVVLRFCASTPRWHALKGEQWRQTIADRARGRQWICEEKNNPGRRFDCNMDHYKSLVARAYEAPALGQNGEVFPGARIFHRDAPHEYAKHMTAEVYIEEIKEEARAGKEIKIGWNHLTRIPNHFWDCCWMSYALADICRHRGANRPAAPKPDYRPRDGGGAPKAGGWKIGR